MASPSLFLIYLGVFLYIIETKVLEFLMQAKMADVLLTLAMVLSTAGTLMMAFFFIMSSLYLGRDTMFMASLPIRPRMLLGAKLTQVWMSETLIAAVIILPACILYGVRAGVDADFYLRMVLVWLLAAVLPICIVSFISAFLIRLSVLWRHREMFMTVGGIGLFVIYMIVMMNVGAVTGDSGGRRGDDPAVLDDNTARIQDDAAVPAGRLGRERHAGRLGQAGAVRSGQHRRGRTGDRRAGHLLPEAEPAAERGADRPPERRESRRDPSGKETPLWPT